MRCADGVVRWDLKVNQALALIYKALNAIKFVAIDCCWAKALTGHGWESTGVRGDYAAAFLQGRATPALRSGADQR